MRFAQDTPIENEGEAVLFPYGNKFWVIRAIQGSDKQVADGLGELRYYGPVSDGKDQGHTVILGLTPWSVRMGNSPQHFV
jgi:hypothetical protein